MSFFDFFRKKSLSFVARKTGYVKDQMGIQSRYVRERESWNSHLENTKHYIIETAQTLEKRDSVVVLGSGWLLDVPWQELSEMFTNVYLVDIVQPEQIVVKTKRNSNIHLITADVTGGVVELAEDSKSFVEFCDRLQQLPNFSIDGNPDLVVSVNLLNQLDILLCDYLKEKFSVSEQEVKQVRNLVQQRHIVSLPKCSTCLITDYCEENTSCADGSVQTKDLLYCELPQGTNIVEWKWIFDTNQRYREGHNTSMKVRAMRF